VVEEDTPIETLKIDEKVAADQIARLKDVKRRRDGRAVTRALNELRVVCKQGDSNVMPVVIEAVKAYATEQEICDVYREAFGEYHDPAFY
jgi:methylmalonyl-CoA mutase N-terminal domain/subunit